MRRRPNQTDNYSAAHEIIADSVGGLWDVGFVDDSPWGDEWAPRDDGHLYEPNDGQLGFHESRARFKILFGGRGGGKTSAGAQEAIRTRIRAGLSGAVVNPDMENFKFSTWPELRRWVPWDRVIEADQRMGGFGWEPRGNFVIHFKNGAVVYCKGLKNPDAARGPNINWLWYDEGGRDRTGQAFKLAVAGVRVGPSPAAWVTTTPRGMGHWTAKTFIGADVPDEIKTIMAEVGHDGPLYSVHYTSIHDNRANLDPLFYASMLTMYAGKFAEQELGGVVIDTIRGLVYDKFGIDNVSELAEYDPERGPVEIAYDDGFSTNPRVLLFIQVDDDGVVNVFNEFFHYQHDGSTCVDESKSLLVKTQTRFFDPERSKNISRPGEPLGYGDQWRPAPDRPPVRAAFEIAVGDPSAAQLRKTFRNGDIVARIPKEKSVVEGIKLVSAIIRSDDDFVGLRVHPRCKNFIRELSEGYKWPDRGDEFDDWVWDESVKPIKENDHGADAFRYWATLRQKRRGV